MLTISSSRQQQGHLSSSQMHSCMQEEPRCAPGGDLREQDLVAVPQQAPRAGVHRRHAAVRPGVQRAQQRRARQLLARHLARQLVQRRQQHLHASTAISAVVLLHVPFGYICMAWGWTRQHREQVL